VAAVSLLDVLRTGVAIADSVTKPVQATVRFRRYVSGDEYGTKVYSPNPPAVGLPLKAVVDWKQKQVRTPDGVLSVSRASVTFLDIKALVIATAGEGVDDNDQIVLPDGTTGPILDMSGFIDAGTGQPIATEVFLG
jgi:hypothetical protein